jgi:predicted nuclease with TOPRIM domain
MSFEENQKKIENLQKEDEALVAQIQEALKEVTNSLVKDFSEEKHNKAMKKYQKLHDRHIQIQDEILSLSPISL